VLVVLADRIHAVFRDTDTPARIRGDEFAVLVEGFEGTELLERVTRRLIDTISEPISVDGVSVAVGVSIGIVSADDTITEADALLARADAAMYAAKAAGRGRFVFAAGSAPEIDVRDDPADTPDPPDPSGSSRGDEPPDPAAPAAPDGPPAP
jgi:diguanylate cyclase (GGDEF)-like protein